MDRDRIIENLTNIESTHGVKILYAVESGSRAWGFESLDSDFDVRFIYVHPLTWYLRIDLGQDVIEETTGDLDLAGWDIKKALFLFRKSNPPLLEWLRSPIIYCDRYSLATRLRQLSDEHFSPRAVMHHYLHMAQGNYRDYLQGETVRLKKYFYVLRPLFACEWLHKRNEFPPMEFHRVTKAIEDPAVLGFTETLLEQKLAGRELDTGPKIPTLDSYIRQSLDKFEQIAATSPKRLIDNRIVDRLFLESLSEAWGPPSF